MTSTFLRLFCGVASEEEWGGAVERRGAKCAVLSLKGSCQQVLAPLGTHGGRRSCGRKICSFLDEPRLDQRTSFHSFSSAHLHSADIPQCVIRWKERGRPMLPRSPHLCTLGLPSEQPLAKEPLKGGLDTRWAQQPMVGEQNFTCASRDRASSEQWSYCLSG